MLTRRALLDHARATALATPFAGFAAPTTASAQDGPLFRFGIVADPQYAPVPPRRTRYYANTLWKLSEAVERFNGEELQFVATLGDIIDRHWESYAHILPVYDRLRHPHFFVLGNHDFEVARDYLGSVLRATGLERAHYDFAGGGHRFIVVDGNEVSLFAHPEGSAGHAQAERTLAALAARGAVNAQPWNGGLSDEQFDWLRATLERARQAQERVIVFGHYPVHPENELNLWGYERFVELVTGYENFVAYMSGHNHAGNFASIGRKHFVNFKGMVETPAQTAFAIVEVHRDRLEIIGHGLETSRSLAI